MRGSHCKILLIRCGAYAHMASAQASAQASSSQALLNRAVLSSPSDARFVGQLLRLAEEEPVALLDALLLSASLDERQAHLAHELLALVPTLATQASATSGPTPLLLLRLREAVSGAARLPPARRAALLAFVSRLHQPLRRAPSVAAALVAAAQGAGSEEGGLGDGAGRLRAALEAMSEPAFGAAQEEEEIGREEEREGKEDGGSAVDATAADPVGGSRQAREAQEEGEEGEEEEAAEENDDGAESGGLPPPVQLEELPPLVGAAPLLAHALLPSLRPSAPSEVAALCLSALQGLLAASSRLDGTGSPRRLSTPLLCASLTAALRLVAAHAARPLAAGSPVAAAAQSLSQACVQLLLPRATPRVGLPRKGLARGAGPGRQQPCLVRLASEQWRALPWRVQLLTWPLLDRLAPRDEPREGGVSSGQPAAAGQRPAASGQRPAASGQRPGAGRRLIEWLLQLVPRRGLLYALVCCAAVPSLPVRQAVRELGPLGGEAAAEVGAEAAAGAAGGAAAGGAAGGAAAGHAVAAVALGLAVTPHASWGAACSQLRPLLCAVAESHSRADSSSAAALRAVAPLEAPLAQTAVALLSCSLALGRGEGGGEALRRAFCTGLSKWLCAAAREAETPCAAVLLLGVGVRCLVESGAGGAASEEPLDARPSDDVGDWPLDPNDGRLLVGCLELRAKLLAPASAAATGGDAAVGGALRESLLGAQRLPAGVARMLLVGSPPGESVVPISMIDPPRRVQ